MDPELNHKLLAWAREWRREFLFQAAMLVTVSVAGLMELLYYENFLAFVIWGFSFALWLDNARKSFSHWRECVFHLKGQGQL